jgi:hypothetical protein
MFYLSVMIIAVYSKTVLSDSHPTGLQAGQIDLAQGPLLPALVPPVTRFCPVGATNANSGTLAQGIPQTGRLLFSLSANPNTRPEMNRNIKPNRNPTKLPFPGGYLAVRRLGVRASVYLLAGFAALNAFAQNQVVTSGTAESNQSCTGIATAPAMTVTGSGVFYNGTTDIGAVSESSAYFLLGGSLALVATMHWHRQIRS